MTDSPHHVPVSAADTDGQRVFGETMLSISRAARSLPAVRGKKTPHPNTLIRWAKTGLKSKSGKIIRLEISRVGGTTCTSANALRRFFERLDDVEPIVPPGMPSQLQSTLAKQVNEAEKILRERGLLE